MKSAEKSKRLVLLDTHAILHRAYHALPEFASSKGEPTGALYGLCTMLLKIVADLKPDYIVACYDLPGKTYRHEAYDAYKAGRSKTDDALVHQIIRSRDVFEALAIPTYEKEGFEADDMLGTISTHIVENNKKISKGATGDAPGELVDVIIASGDMDTLQLVHGREVMVYTLKKGINDTILYDEDAVKERFGFGPELLPDYKGLRGDPSDNIIGIKGIGEKTGSTLIQTFGTIEDMYAALKKDEKKFKEAGLTERVINLVRDGEEEAKFSKMLATIRRDAPIDFVVPEKVWRESVKLEKVLPLFTELEFRTLATRMRDLFGGKAGVALEANSRRAAKSAQGGDESAGASEASDDSAESFESNMLTERVLEDVPPAELRKVSIAAWVLNSNIPDAGLEEILDFTKKDTFAEARDYIFAELEKQGMMKIYRGIEEPIIPIVDRMEKRGVKIDPIYLGGLSKAYHATMNGLEKEIWELAGREFNVASPKQLGEILFDVLKLETKGLKKTSGGARSTKESELEKLRDAHPIIGKVLEYRELAKLVSTYIDTIPTMLDTEQRLHTTFVQNGTTTGRMSSQNPNLQNIPIKTDLGRRIRNAFVASKGYSLVAFDYSQVELRVAAFLSGDEKLIEIFKSGQDVHASVASYVFQVPVHEVDKEMRRKAKVINFGILYGMGVNALKQNLGTDMKEARKFYDDYFQTFSRLASYLEQVKKDAAEHGYTETLFGRRRYFEGIRSKIPFIRAAAERMAINAPIQGTNADMVKISLAHIEAYLTKEGLKEKVWPILQVHDELVYEIDEALVKTVSRKIKEIMESVVSLQQTKGVPIIANASAGPSWDALEKLL